jgi:hypothetical protein
MKRNNGEGINLSINFLILLPGVGGMSGIVEPVNPSVVASMVVGSKVVDSSVVISSVVVSSIMVVVITVVVLATGGVFISSVVSGGLVFPRVGG